MTIKNIILIGVLMIGLASCNSKLTMLSDFTTTDYYKWNKVELDETTFCSDSSNYYLLSKRGKSDNLIIHFAGGGACWDNETCTLPIEFNLKTMYKMGVKKKVSSFYLPEIPKGLPRFMNGIFDNENAENPFQDWNIVFIPYCTGDLHFGDATNTYTNEDGETLEVRHNGQSNVDEALKWVNQHFKNPKKILVSGSSAGGFAALFHTPTIEKQYTKSKIYQLADCSYVYSGRWSQILDSTWNVDWAGQFGFKLENDAVKETYLNTPKNSKVTYLQINSLYDFVMTQFWAISNGHSLENKEYIKQWSNQMTEMVKEVSESGVNYQYFVTDYKFNDKREDTPHTFLNRAYYKCEEEGILLTEWLRQNVIEDKKVSIGKAFLEKDTVQR